MANENDYGIVIGIEFYKEALGQLKGPHADAKRFSDWLLNPQGGNLPAKNVKLLQSTETYDPVLENINDWWVGLLEELTKDQKRARRLYLYFSGHGAADSAKNSAMLFPKWSHVNRQYGLSSEKYLEGFISSGAFAEVYIFMDCCRNRISNVAGSFPYNLGGKPSSNSCEFFVFYSSEFDNSSYEVTLNNDGETLNDLLPRGLFTEVLLNGLHGAAADKNGKLDLDCLIKYVTRALPQLANSRKKAQFPRSELSVVTMKKLLTPSFPPKVDLKITFNKKDKSKLVLEDPELNVIKEGSMSDGQWEVQLSRGYHLLRKTNGEEGLFFYADGLEKVLHFE